MTATIMLCTESHLPLLRLSLPRLLAVGITPTVSCCGKAVEKVAIALGAAAVLLPKAEGGAFGTPEFAKFISTKLDIIISALRTFDDVLFLDTDVDVYSDPLPTIDKSYDIFAQTDARPDVDGDAVCTGCWWLRSSPAVLSFLAAARARQVDECKRRFYCDEAAVNDELLESHSLRVGYAPSYVWQNAARWLASDRSVTPQLIHWNGRGHYSVAEKLAAISQHTPAGSPSSRRAEPALAPDRERTAS